MEMNGIILLCALLACTFALDQKLVEEYTANVMEIGLECAETEHATTEDVVALKNYLPPVTHQGKCVLFCMNKKFNVMNEDGLIIESPSNEWMDKANADDAEFYEKLLKLQKTCYDKVPPKEDACDTAQEYYICIIEQSKKVGIDKILF